MTPRKDSVGTPATVALERAGIAFTVHPYEHDPRIVLRGTSYGLEAATTLGVPAGRVFKTLLAEVDGGLVVAVVPVSGKLDLKALAAVLGGKRATMADPVAAERQTGYVVGGISPIGQRKRLPTVVDSSALAHETVFVSAGRRGVDLELRPADLITITNAATAWLARP